MTQGVGFESALRAYMADCLTQDDCPFRGTLDEAMADLGTLLASVDRSPLRASDGRELGRRLAHDGDRRGAVLRGQLAVPDDRARATRCREIRMSPSSSPTSITTARTASTSTTPTEAFRAYNCMDYPADSTPEQEAAAQALLAEEAPTVAPYWCGSRRVRDVAVPADGRPRGRSRPRAPRPSWSWVRRTILRRRTSGRCRSPSSCRRAC